MKKIATQSRSPVLATVAGVLVACALAWVCVDYFVTSGDTPDNVAIDAGRARINDQPLWDELSSAQQIALAPLEPEWQYISGTRKRQWIEMSARFASMAPNEQQRVHQRMREWMRLTPAQRERARENFSKANKLTQGGKSADWESYNQLSEEQKRTLAQSKGRERKPLAAPGAPQLSMPTPCPAHTTRRGAECIVIEAPAAPAPAAPILDATNAPAAGTPSAGAPSSNASELSAPAANSAPPNPASPAPAAPIPPANASN